MPESYLFEDETIDVIRNLWETFAVTSDAEVISRALALAKVIGAQADEKHMVVVHGKDGPVKVDLIR